MDQLIPVINKLQEVFEAIDPDAAEIGITPLDLPRIAVVGSQSSGKSSVLECLVQRDFLPRGKDIVTRRPLILQLIYNPPNPNMEEWAEFGHLPGKKFRDFLAVRREIEMDTERVAGSNKGISKHPINLKIHSPRVVNLTLVDLPGITKIPVGEQPADIEAQIRQLIFEYISRPNSVILAVTPANSDLANSDALKLAREVDPTGVRTIGVLTKLDLMDAGTHAADILMNRAGFRLKLGFVGVVNRSQHDININKPISEALKQELEFFRSHPAYRSIAQRCGTQFLAKELNKILLYNIRDQLPELRSRINNLIVTTQSELTSLGDLGLPGKAHRGTLLLKLVTNYVTDFHAAIDGTLRRDNNFYTANIVNINNNGDGMLNNNGIVMTGLEEDEDFLSGGARISQIFNETYAYAVTHIEPVLSLIEVRNAIRNASGPRPSLFVPEASFELLARKQISKLAGPAQKCADLVFEELQELAHQTDRKREFRRFPKLTAKMIEITSNLLKERLEPTLEMIDGLVKIEMAYINTNHPDFVIRSGTSSMTMLARIVEASGAKRVPNTTTTNNLATNTITTRSASDETGNISSPTFSSIQSPITNTIIGNNGNKEEGGLFSYLFRGGAGGGGGGASSPKSVLLDKRTKRHQIETNNGGGGGISSNQADNNYMAEEQLITTSGKEEMETQLILGLLQSYFGIVKKNLLDSVPKAIMHYLVNYVVENLGTRLVTELYKEELFNDLLEEDEGVIKQRVRCRTALEAYRQAATILTELRDPQTDKTTL